jgi:hypothetical protein
MLICVLLIGDTCLILVQLVYIVSFETLYPFPFVC